MTRQRLTIPISALLVLISCINVTSALFEGCDHNYNINAGYTYLESPYYPNYYPASTSCRYKFTAPLDYDIHINCTIDLKKNPSACSTEFFYVATDGDTQLRGSEQFCGQGVVIRKSLFRSVVLAYASYGSNGRFRCQLYAAPQPCDCGWSVNTKIVNGQQTGVNEYPSMVALRDRTSSNSILCGATILSHRYLLTAAHCSRSQPNPANLLAIVGEHDLSSTTETRYTQTYYIQQIIEHPNYTPSPVSNDLALLLTTQNIEWSRGVGPICLPPSASNSFAYQYADVLGWGTTSFSGPTSRVLLKVTLQVVENSACTTAYQGQAPIYASHICTYDYAGQRRDSCQYDSGGPVILRSSRQFLIGCISFGKICGEGNYAMGVNTRITSFLTWIQSYTGARFIFRCSLVACLISILVAQSCQPQQYYINSDRQVLNITSPNYPYGYRPGTQCRYRVVAPLDHVVILNCRFEIYPDTCNSEYFYVSRDGDFQFRDAETYCRSGIVNSVSHFRAVAFAFFSNNALTSAQARFNCQAFARPQRCNCGWSVSTKITNGHEAGRQEYPSMVALRELSSTQRIFCGGSIVSHRHIITAAHCMRSHSNVNSIVAYVGDHDLTIDTESAFAAQHRIQRIINHPGYVATGTSVANDISLLVTATIIEWSRGVAPICLPFREAAESFAYLNVDVIGWGTVSFAGSKSNTLRKVQLLTMENRACQMQYNNTIVPSQICTYDYRGLGQDSCQYDSGGPVIFKQERHNLVGIISFGQTCGTRYAIGVNTRVTSHLNWLWGHIGGVVCIA